MPEVALFFQELRPAGGGRFVLPLNGRPANGDHGPNAAVLFYYFIAGEPSGDLHGAHLMRALRAVDPDARFRAWGGDRMVAEGAELVRHYRDTAYMGIGEVVRHLPAIRRNFALCRADLAAHRPDAVVFIDYSGFNLRVAPYAKRLGLRTYYYVAPQVWAWRRGRVRQIKRYVDRTFVLFPFELPFYARHGYAATYVGHPLADIVDHARTTLPDRATFLRTHPLDGRPLVALLPGSRAQELRAHLPLMAAAAADFPDHQFVVAATSALPAELYAPHLAGHDVALLTDQTYPLLAHATAGVVKSGTSTLEAALLGLPHVIGYRTSPLTYAVVRRLVKVKYIGLPNLVLDAPVVPELIQHDFNAPTLRAALTRLLHDDALRARMQADFERLRHQLGGGQVAQRVARQIITDLRP